MPNHIQNRVVFECGEEKLKEILTKIQSDDTENKYEISGPGTIDFNKIIPMPDTVYRGLLGAKERELYGNNNWYDWSIANWGTKWNAYSFSHNNNEIAFQTAWSAPHPVLEELSHMFPGVYITHRWADEDIGNNCGTSEYLNGEIVGSIIPETGKEALDLAFEVWGYTADDFDMCLNASNTDYIRTDDNEFELIELFGTHALFSNERLTTDDIPLGMYVYHVREDESNSFSTLESGVSINHYGSIITNKPIDFGESGYINFNVENSPNFIGEYLTLGQFMRGEFEQKEGMTLG